MKNKGASIIMVMMFIIIIILLVCVIGLISFGSLDNMRVSIVEMLGGTVASENTPTEEAIVAAPTTEPTATPTEEPTATPSEEPTATPTEEPTATPTEEATATPTEEPTATPTEEATATPTEKPTTEPTAEPTVTLANTTDTPAPAQAGATSAGGLSFEQFGTWKRGDQPYGTFAQSANPVHEGSFAGKLNYDFSAGSAADDYVIFTQAIATSGKPNLVQAWVNGDGSGHLMNIWIEDANGEVWSAPLGKVSFTGWQQMTGVIDVNTPWPGGRVYGPDNGAIDYPIRFLGMVVDRTDGPKTGTLSFDDITFSEGAAPATPAPAAGAAAAFTSCPKIDGALGVICYDIEGSTADQLIASMKKNNPVSDQFFIATDSGVSWNWDGYGQSNCLLDTATASMRELTSYVAIWKSPAGAPPDLVAQWDNYFVTRVGRAQIYVNSWNARHKEIESAIKGATCATADTVAEDTRVKIRSEILAQMDAAIPPVEFYGIK